MSAVVPEGATEGLVDPQGLSGHSPDSTEGQNGLGDHGPTVEERVRQDPDFAMEQIQKRDQNISKLALEAKKFEPLAPFIDVAGGADGLLQLAQLGQQVRQVPGLLDIAQQSIQEGRVPTPAQEPVSDPNDEFLDEDTKRIRDELRSEMGEIKQMLGSMTGEVANASIRSQETHIQRNVDEAIARFKDVPEAHTEALELIEKRVRNAQAMAQNGNAAQRQVIEQLGGPEGARVLQFMLIEEGLIDKYGAQLYGASEPTPQNDQVVPGVKQTDARTTNPSRPVMPPLPPLEKGQRVTEDNAMAIYRAVRQRKGRPLS